MKFRHRITAFIALGAMLVALGAAGVLSPVLVRTADVRDAHAGLALLTAQMTSRAREAGRLGQTYVASGQQEDLLAFKASAVRFESELAGYERLRGYFDDGEGASTEPIETAWADASAMVEGRVAGLSGAIDRLSNELVEHEREEAARAMSTLSVTAGRARAVVLVLAALVITGIVVVGAFASHSVVRPLAVLDAAAQRLADGELDQEIPQVGDDEIGALAAVIEMMRVNLRGALDSLRGQIEEQTATEEILAAANNELNHLLESAKRSGDEMDLTGEMDELLQADLSWSEAYAVIANYGRRLFAQFQGALYLYDGDNPVLVRAVEWGDAEPLAERYALDECWSLRTARAHWARVDKSDLPPCEHLHAPGACSACAPLVAHGDRFGTIVLRGRNGSDPCGQPGAYEHVRAMLASFAGRVALAMSNMQLRETLREQALRDPLTGLYNRRVMEEGLGREIARAGRDSTPLVVGFVDIDHFKDFNDTYSHEAGDYVLRQVGAYLRDNTRAGDLVSRYGGEEFVTVWLGADLASAFARAESLRKGVAALHLELDGEALGGVTLSIGMALLGEHGDSADALLSAADAALYEAKGEGRDRVVIAPVPARALERQALAIAASGLVELRAGRYSTPMPSSANRAPR